MQILNVHVCVYVIGPDHSQVNSGQGRVPVSNDIVSSPGAEGSPPRSEVSPGQIAADTVNVAESSNQLERPAPAVDNASEPAQPSAGAAGKLSLPDTEPVGNDIQRVQEGSSSQASCPQTGGVDDHNQQVEQGSTSQASQRQTGGADDRNQQVEQGSTSQPSQPQTGGADDRNQQVEQGSTSQASERQTGGADARNQQVEEGSTSQPSQPQTGGADDHNQQVEEGSTSQASQRQTGGADDRNQQVEQGSTSQASQPQAGGVDDHNQQVEEGSTSETSEPAPSTSPVVVDPVAKSETHSQHNADSEAVPSVDDETVVNDDSSSSQSQPVDQHDVHAGKPVDSQSDSSAEHDHSPPVNDTEPSVGPDDDNVIHPLHTGEPVDEEIDQLMDEMTESTGDEPHSVDMDDSVDKELSARDNTDVKNLKDEFITEQLTADDDDDKDDGDNYLSPVIGLWTPVDVWLMTCIDSVSIQTVIK